MAISSAVESTSTTIDSAQADGLEFRDVSKTFRLAGGREVPALAEFALQVPRGQFVALLGPSGCGKSTALRIAAGLENPDRGTVRVLDEAPEQVAATGRLGVAFQDNALLPWLSVARNIALPYKLMQREVDTDRVDYLIDLVGLSDFRKAKPRQLSGGMRQRVSIARALVLAPQLLLLDEPFGALDAVTRHRLNVELARILAEERSTTLLVTHSVEEAVFLADRVVVMTPRPGTVKQIVDVPFGTERSRQTLEDPQFQELVTALTKSLDETTPGTEDR